MSLSHLLLTSGIVSSVFLATGAAAEPIRVGLYPWVGWGPLYVAEDQGYFVEEGVEVELVSIDDYEDRFAALNTGEIQAVATTVDAVFNYMADGQHYLHLFATDESRGGDAFIASNDIATMADLAGKRVAFPSGTVAAFALEVLLDEAGLSTADIEAVDLRPGSAGDAFFAGDVDASFAVEPWIGRAREAEDSHVLWDSSQSPGLVVDTLVTTDTLATEHGDEFRALYRAWLRGIDYQRANEKESDAVMAAGLGGWLEDPSVVAEARAGVVFGDAAFNQAYFGNANAPGPVIETIEKAREIAKRSASFDADVEPVAMVDFGVVNQ